MKFVLALISAARGLKWIASGSGLDARINLPVRHFYVEVQGDNGEKIDVRDLEDYESVEFTAQSQGNKVPMRGTNGITWDGRLMFRYRIPLWQDGATYSIKYKGEEVLSIDVEGHINDEACHCPLELEDFYETYKCPKSFSQLDKDLGLFKEIDLDRLKQHGEDKKWGTEATIHYVIKDNQI